MSLTTEFEEIDPKKVDARIDALGQIIEAQLDPIIQGLQQTRALERATQSWYDSNTANTVHRSANSGETVTQQSIEHDISATSVNVSDGAEFSPRVEKLMERRPGFSLGAIFKGQVRNQKVTFLDDLKEKGEAIIAEAKNDLEQAQTSLGQTRDEQWECFEGVQGFYDDLTQALTAQDTDALLTVIQSDSAKAIPPSQRRDLLLKPMNAHDTAMLAIIEITDTEPKKESEAVAVVLNSFGSDFEALRVIQNSVPKIQDEEQRNRYEAYVNAFVGTFIPIGNNVVNANMIGYADKNEVLVPACNGSNKGYPKSLNIGDDSEAVLTALTALPNYVRIGDAVVNTNMIGYADQSEVIVPGSNGGNKGYPKSLNIGDDSEAVLALLEERPNFVRIGNNVVNANRIGYADQSEVIVPGSNGSNRGYPKSLNIADDSEAVLAALTALPNFVRIGDAVVNTNMIGYADQSEVIVPGSDASGRGYPKSLCTGDDGEAVLTALEERANFVRIGNNVINANMIGYADQSEVIVPGSNANGRGYPKSLSTSDNGEAVLTALAALPNFVRIGDAVVNANRIGYADQSEVLVPGSNADGRGYPKSLSTGDDGEAVLAALEERANFVRIGNNVINASMIGYADQSEALVPGSNADGRGYPKSLSTGDDGEALKKIRQLGQRTRIMQTHAGHRTELMHGLHEARAWESDYRDTHQNSDGLMDYLPLIVVGAIISSDDHGQPEIHGLDTLDEQAGPGSIDVDNEFAVASGLTEMAALDNGFGVDSFEADFAHMDTGIVGDLDDFGAGGGMDMGGGTDSSSDFGGLSFD